MASELTRIHRKQTNFVSCKVTVTISCIHRFALSLWSYFSNNTLLAMKGLVYTRAKAIFSLIFVTAVVAYVNTQ